MVSTCDSVKAEQVLDRLSYMRLEPADDNISFLSHTSNDQNCNEIVDIPIGVDNLAEERIIITYSERIKYASEFRGVANTAYLDALRAQVPL